MINYEARKLSVKITQGMLTNFVWLADYRLGRKQFSSLNMMCVVTVGDCVVRSVLFQWVTVPGVCVVTVGVCVRSVYCYSG